MKNLFFECGVEICDHPVKVKFYKEDGKGEIIEGYYFELSHFLKSSVDMDVYKHPDNMGETMEHCISRLNIYIQRFNDVDKVENNNDFYL